MSLFRKIFRRKAKRQPAKQIPSADEKPPVPSKSPAEQQRLAWQQDHAAFFKAIKKGHLDKIAEIVKKYPDEALDWQTDARKKCLHVAIAENQPEVLHLLIDLGAKPNQTSVYQDPDYSLIDAPISVSALNAALYYNKADMVYALLERGASKRNAYGRNFASKHGSINDMVKRADKIQADYKKRKAAEKEAAKAAKRAQASAEPAELIPPPGGMVITKRENGRTTITRFVPLPPPKPEPAVTRAEFDALKKQLTQALARIEALEEPTIIKIEKPQQPQRGAIH